MWILEDEKRKVEERYVLLAGEKFDVEDQVTILDGEVERLSMQVRDLAAKKEALEAHIRQQSEQLAFEASTRRALKGDLAWIMQEGVIRVVNRLSGREEFSFGVRSLKATCVAAGIESGKQAV